MENICSGTYAAMRVNAVSGERAKVEDSTDGSIRPVLSAIIAIATGPEKDSIDIFRERIEIGIGYDDKIEVRLEKRNNRCKQLAGAIESGH
jgi:hypothetical protein